MTFRFIFSNDEIIESTNDTLGKAETNVRRVFGKERFYALLVKVEVVSRG